MIFSDELLSAVGAWQNGWREQATRRLLLADDLQKASEGLHIRFRTVSSPCYRKRFLHEGELVALLVENCRDEGIVSWTTDIQFAERFKGVYRASAVSGAIFKHTPNSEEVVLNISALWADVEFENAASDYAKRNGKFASALINFQDTQGEVVLTAPLKGSEIIALTGASSPFDEICDDLNIPSDHRDQLFSDLVAKGIHPGGASLHR